MILWHARHPALRRRRGFTLIEMVVATTLFSLITLSVMALFTTMLRLCASVTSGTSASLDAANAIQRVTGDMREAFAIQLMDGGIYSDTYDSKDGLGNYIAVTGVRILYPMPLSVENGNQNVMVDTAGASNISVPSVADRYNNLAVMPTTLAQPAGPPYVLDIYRSDTSGNPRPNDGTCLWALGYENGDPNTPVNTAIVKTIAPNKLDAVQFIQPTDVNSVPLKNEAKIKITCSLYDPVHGYNSSDASNGNVSALTGECIYLRVHDPGNTTLGGAHGKEQTSGS